MFEPGLDYIGVGTCAVCHDGEGKLFLNKRGPKCRDEWNKWDNCGGALRFGESPEQCLLRELKEEYGCEPLEYRAGGLVNAIREIGERKTHWLIFTYLVKVDPKTVKICEPEKMIDSGWFDLGHLPKNRHSYFDRDFATIKDLWEEYYSYSSTDRTAAS